MEQLFLDVGSPEEHTEDYLEDSLNIPHYMIMNNLHQLPEDREILVYCHSGTRSELVTVVLERLGYNVINIGTIDMAKSMTEVMYE